MQRRSYFVPVRCWASSRPDLSLAVPVPPGRPHIDHLPPAASYCSAGLEPGVVVSRVDFDFTSQSKSEVSKGKDEGGEERQDEADEGSDNTCIRFHSVLRVLYVCVSVPVVSCVLVS